MKNKKYLSIAMGVATIAGLAVGTPAFADTNTNNILSLHQGDQGDQGAWRGQGMMMRPGVVGTVSAISGSTITITSKIGPRMMGPGENEDGNRNENQNQNQNQNEDGDRNENEDVATSTPAIAITSATYTIDASNATVIKAGVSSSVSSIAVGDTLFISGTVTGTNVVAKAIIDGLPMNRTGRGDNQGDNQNEKGGPVDVPAFTGNGQPLVAGSISTISGHTITVTTSTGIAYTVDATNAKVLQGPNTITLSNLVVGNSVIVQGAVNGTAITASSILDQNPPAGSNDNGNGDSKGEGGIRGFFGNIKGFFMHLFGF